MQPRVVMVVAAFPALSETFIVTKALGLLRRGWDVHVVCSESPAEEWARFPEVEEAGMRRRVHVTPGLPDLWSKAARIPRAALRTGFRPATWRYLRDPSLPLADRLRRWYLDEALIRLRPDLVHIAFGMYAPDRMHIKRLLGCRIVVSFLGFDLYVAELDDPDRYADVWEHADALHLLSHDLWNRARERGCPPSKPHALIPGGIDLAEFVPGEAPTRAEGEPLRILSVGRKVWQKGYEFGLQAVRILKDRGVPFRYRIIGGEADSGWIRFTVHDLGLDDVVEMTGPLPPDQVIEALRHADVFLQASVTEGFCNAVLEAQAMKVPVVCSDGGGLPENVADGETGFVVPRRDPTALADRIEQLAADPALRRRFGEAGRRRVADKFALEDETEALERLYRQALDAR